MEHLLYTCNHLSTRYLKLSNLNHNAISSHTLFIFLKISYHFDCVGLVMFVSKHFFVPHMNKGLSLASFPLNKNSIIGLKLNCVFEDQIPMSICHYISPNVHNILVMGLQVCSHTSQHVLMVSIVL